MNALDPINLSIEFVKQTVDPGGGGEVVNAQTGDIAIWAILAILFVGVIAYCMFRISRVFNGEYATAAPSAKHAKNAHRGGRLATTKAGLVFAIIGLIICLSMTATSAIAASNKTNANNVDIQPDKIQVTVDEAAGTINDATFNFVNNSQNYYLFDSTTKMELTSEVQGLTVPEDWELQLTTLNTDLYNGVPDGHDYPVPDSVVTLYPGQSAQATLKFNKGSAELANTLIGKQVFSLTMLPDQYVVGEPQAQTGFTYDGTVHTAIAPTDAYTVTTGSATNAGNYQATITLKTDYKWPDKTSDTKHIDWNISPRIVELVWNFPMDTEYNGNVQHPSASVMNIVSSDNVSVDEYSFPEGDDGKSAGDHTVFVKSLKGPDKDNYTLEGAWTKYSSYTINPKPMTITADNKEKAIGDEEDPELTASVDGNIETEIFVKDKDYELSRETGEEVIDKEFAIHVKVKGTSDLAKNYQITTTDGKLVIVDNKPTITPDSITITYGDSEPALTATTNYTQTGYDLVKDTDYKLTRVQGENYGEYKISVELIDSGPGVIHYGKNNIRLKEGLFTINQYSVRILWDDFVKLTYTGTPQYGSASLYKAKDSDDVEIGGYESFNEEYDCTSAGDQKCKVAELTGEQSINYTLDHASNVYEYTIDKADIAMTVSVTGGNVTKPKGYKDTTLTSSYTLGAIAPDQSTLHFTYQWGKMETGEISPYIPIEGATSANYTIGKDDHLGTYSFSVTYNVTTDDTNFKAAEIHSTGVDVSLLYIKMTFNDQQSNTTTERYTHYGTTELYTSATDDGDPQEIPTASKAGCVFNGWYTAATEGTQVIDFKNSILHTAVDGYISSDGTWANTKPKTLYAGLYQVNYLTFTNEAEGSNEITFKQTVSNDCNMNPILIRYSTNATDWDVLETSGSISASLATLTSFGDKLYVAGYNPGGFSAIDRKDRFASTGKFSVTGSYGSLLDFTKSSVTQIPNSYCFQYLFSGCSGLTSAPDVDLTFTENEVGCYNHMFDGCSSLNKLAVSFEEWPENGFDGWVEGLSTDGTCEFDCPATLDWKCVEGNYCPKNWHNSKGEARWYIDENDIINFYVGDEKTPASYGIVPIDNDEVSPFKNYITEIKGISCTESYINWTDNLRSLNAWFSGATLLNELGLSRWNKENLWTAKDMFKNCSALSKIYCNIDEDWCESSYLDSETSTNMFLGATSLPGYDPNNIDCEMAKSVKLGGYFTEKLELYAQYKNSTLTFFYGNELSDGTIYDVPLNSASLTDVPWYENRKNILTVRSTKEFCYEMYYVESTFGWFYEFENLSNIDFISTTEDAYWVASNVTNTSNMFKGCNKLTDINLNIFSASALSNTSSMFEGCAKLPYVDVSAINITRNAITDKMFSECPYLAVIEAEDYTDWSNDFTGSSNDMFYNSKALPNYDSQKIDISMAKVNGGYFMTKNREKAYASYNSGVLSFYTDLDIMPANNNNNDIFEVPINSSGSDIPWSSVLNNVTSINSTVNFNNWSHNIRSTAAWFKGASKLENFEFLSNWNLNDLINMSEMFSGCSSASNLNVTSFNTNKVKSFNECFCGMTNLTQISFGENWNTSNAEDLSGLFKNCSSFTFDKYPAFMLTHINTSSAKTVKSMFEGCLVAEFYLDDFQKLDWSNIEDASYMFYQCHNLFTEKTTLTLKGCKNIKTLSHMFDECTSNTDLGLENFVIDASDTEGERWTKLEDMSFMFNELPLLKTVKITSGGKYFTSLKYTNCMFNRCYSFDLYDFQLNGLPNFYTHNVIDMSSMFNNCRCTEGKDVDFRNLDVSSVTNMESMFFSVMGVNLLNLASWNTSNVTNFSNMFCSSDMTSINIKNFNINTGYIENVDLYHMFYQCNFLTKIICDNDWSSVPFAVHEDEIFLNCSKLPGYSTDKIGIEMAKPRSQGGYFDTA